MQIPQLPVPGVMRSGISRAIVGLALLSVGCGLQTPVKASVQQLRSGVDIGGHLVIGADLLVTGMDDEAIACGEGTLEVTMEVAVDSEDYREVPGAVEVTCTPVGLGDFALVIDNSGSEDGYLEQLRGGARTMATHIVEPGGKGSLVRVSTESKTLVPLTASLDDLLGEIDELYINRGWTALYDGIRIGNETLGGAIASVEDAERTDGARELCSNQRRAGVVVFTDGHENNSSHQSHWTEEYPGDGIDTSLEDLHQLRIDGVTTPVYTIGVGDRPDHEGLRALADHTGGRHLAIDESEDLREVFGVVSDYFHSTHQVCASVPRESCGWLNVRLNYTFTHEGETLTSTREQRTFVDCPPPATSGRSLTVLLTLSNPGIERDVAERIAGQAVSWTSGVESPKVLIVLDDNHHDEFKDDGRYVEDLLEGLGYDVDYQREPRSGMELADFAGYDVVWLSNPGYSPDDESTVNALAEFGAAGGGVVLQGDDMSWAWGHEFSMAAMTHLDHVDNGTRYCGEGIDNNRGGNYEVRVTGDHPVVDGLDGVTFLYGDDIDTSRARSEGEQVLAWATVAGADDGCDLKPVIVAYDP